jgi:hypothetical protein
VNGNWGEGKPKGRPLNEYLDFHTCQIERNVYRRIKILAVKRNIKIRDLLTMAIEEFLQQEESE